MDTNRTAQTASARILALVAAGLDPVDALRTVCGAAAVDAMIAELYAGLRGKAEALLEAVAAQEMAK